MFVVKMKSISMKTLFAMLGKTGVIPQMQSLRQFHLCLKMCRACIIDGIKKSKEIKMKLKQDIDCWIGLGHRTPHLAVLTVGENPASKIYIRNKMKMAKEIGMETRSISMPASTSEKCLLNNIALLNDDPNVDGVLIQLPLPKHIAEHNVCNAIAPHKDVDGLNAVNFGRFCRNLQSFVPCTALGIYELLRETAIETSGKTAVVCGKSKNVGLPIAILLQADSKGETPGLDATTVICHSRTPLDQLKVFTKSADILVTATGVPHLINADMVKPGACVIDVGITRVYCKTTGKTKLIGDVDFEAVAEVAGYITPVPGGVGPMTVAMLMKNTFLAAQKTVHFG